MKISHLVMVAVFALPLLAFFDEDENTEKTLQVPKEVRHVKVSVISPTYSDQVIGIDVRGQVEPAVSRMVDARSEGVFYPTVENAWHVLKAEEIGKLYDRRREMQIEALDSRSQLLKEQIAIESQKMSQNQEMLDLGIISENVMLSQRSALKDRELQLLQTRSELRRLKLLEKEKTVYAPSDGYIQGLAARGSYITYGAQVATLISKKVNVRLFVDPLFADAIGVDQPVVLHLSSREVNATITAILPQSSSNLIDVIATPSQPLPVGLQLSAVIETEAIEGWVIPKSSIVLEQNRPAVFVIEERHARLHFVTVQKDMLDRVLIVDSLKADDKIADKNAYMLQDGATVEVVQ